MLATVQPRLPLSQRIRSVLRGRFLAIWVLVSIVFVEGGFLFSERFSTHTSGWLSNSVELIRAPIISVRNALFDGYQILSPRIPQQQPVTVIAIDEKSIHALGQWPWPRDRLAQLIEAINTHQPAAIGLDFYMPEADQQSPQQLMQRFTQLSPQLQAQLSALPSNDFQLAMALSQTPSVLGAAGFTVKAYTTTQQLLSAEVKTTGDTQPQSFITNYPEVLASLPLLQQAAAGHALLSVPGSADAIRQFPLLAAVNNRLVPSLPLEMFRVATGTTSIEVQATATGIDAVTVADLTVRTPWNAEVWPYYARQTETRSRYLSAIDVFNGQFDPLILQNKLVLVGLTGAGLSDMRFTALHEHVPGIEIQAQMIEALFENRLLLRPDWLPWFELLLVMVFSALLIWLAPKTDHWLGSIIRYNPVVLLFMLVGLAVFLAVLGFILFAALQLLFASTSVILGVTLVTGVFFVNGMLVNLRQARARIAGLIDSGISLGQQQSREPLLQMTLASLEELAPHQAAIIFLEEENQWQPVTERGLAFHWREHLSIENVEEPEQHSDKAAALQLHPQLRALLAKHEMLSVCADGRDDGVLRQYPFAMLRTQAGNPIRSMLAMPMVAMDQTIRGWVLLFNAVNPAGLPLTKFSGESVRLVETLVAQATIALENQALVNAQQNMMDAMVKIIAGAIDEKSPYTGGHCERVPVLAEMLCTAASEQRDGPLAEFAFTTEDEWREFKTAAWLHDCGKITTPEYVVDKATKLETIYDRIHEVRMRFEVLLRDAQIERLRAIYEQGADLLRADEVFALRQQQLTEDFAFIAQCNQGGEFQGPDKIERIKRIGEQCWLRYFDNRLGLSHDELKRYPDETDTQRLPVEERLLSDRPEHLIERPPSKTHDPKFGFKMEVPEYLYNRGELHNLVVSRGTLTAEERFKINEHMTQTIAILEEVPFPPNLQRIPEIAGAHHETLIGTGYPRKLTKEQLSIPARIMAIADIFEALTASDRPYKKAKSLSEAIQILSFFKQDQHIDPDLFDLFLTSGVYLQYARAFLSPEQIDEVDISRYLN